LSDLVERKLFLEAQQQRLAIDGLQRRKSAGDTNRVFAFGGGGKR
jgi:hypothetical protein